MNLRHTVARYTPDRLGKIPYRLALRMLQARVAGVFGRERPLIWARNSFANGNLVPWLSDLDYTVWFESPPTAQETSRLARTLDKISSIIPFLGEGNVYVATESGMWRPLINHFEINRDPLLAARAGSRTEPLDIRIQAGIFLLRMLEGDVHNVLHHPEVRRKKWNSHLAAIVPHATRPLDPLWKDFPRRSLLRAIVETAVQIMELGESTEEDAIRSLELYFACAGRGVPGHILGYLRDQNPLWEILLPHRFCFGPPRRAADGSLKTSVRLSEAWLAQLSWEACGILAQFRIMRDRRGLREHLGNLKGLLNGPETLSRSAASTHVADVLGRLLETGC